MATHSSILAWKILWAEKPGGLQSMGHKESDTTEHTHTHLLNKGKWPLHSPQRVVWKRWQPVNTQPKVFLKPYSAKNWICDLTMVVLMCHVSIALWNVQFISRLLDGLNGGLIHIPRDIDANDILPTTRSSIFEWKILLLKWEALHMLSLPVSSQRLYWKNEYSMLMLCHLALLHQEACLSPYHCFMDFCKHFYASHGYSHFLQQVRGLLLFLFFSVCFTIFFPKY